MRSLLAPAGSRCILIGAGICGPPTEGLLSVLLNKWFLVTVLLFSVVGAAAPALGAQSAPSACCCSAGSCHCPDSRTTWIPTCCASDDAVPEPVAVANPTTPEPTDSGQRIATDGLIAPPQATADNRSVIDTGGAAPPGLSLFTLHSSFLI
jgi:hypothetical protein